MDASTEAHDLGIASRLTRSRGRTPRDQNANARLTKQELSDLKASAKAEGKALGEWTRDVLLEATRRTKTDTPVFTEVIALRMLLNSVLRTVAVGERMSPEAYAQIIAEVRTDKHAAARELLSQYQAGGK